MSSESRFGLSAALATPFDAGRRIDTGRAIAHARWCLNEGCSSVTLFGTTGEGASIGTWERDEVLEAFLGAGIPAQQVVAGVMANSVQDAAAQARCALDAGCKAVLLAPPSYFKNLDDAGIFAWFADVFAALGTCARDIILYNIPQVTAVALSVELVGRLKAAFPGVVSGVKDSAGNWDFTKSRLAAHRDLAILIGDERSLAAGVRLGGQGAISGMANLCPARMLAMTEEGRDDPALCAFVDELVKYPVISAIKAVVAQRAGDRIWRVARAPLPTLSDAEAGRIIDLYERMTLARAA